MAHLDRVMVIEASTLRAPVLEGGKQGDAEVYLTGLKCTPLDPTSPSNTFREPVTQVPHHILYTLIVTPETPPNDIREGDRLVVDEVEYPIQDAQTLYWQNGEWYSILTLIDLRPTG